VHIPPWKKKKLRQNVVVHNIVLFMSLRFFPYSLSHSRVCVIHRIGHHHILSSCRPSQWLNKLPRLPPSKKRSQNSKAMKNALLCFTLCSISSWSLSLMHFSLCAKNISPLSSLFFFLLASTGGLLLQPLYMKALHKNYGRGIQKAPHHQ